MLFLFDSPTVSKPSYLSFDSRNGDPVITSVVRLSYLHNFTRVNLNLCNTSVIYINYY
jgi:hypothetical protein